VRDMTGVLTRIRRAGSGVLPMPPPNVICEVLPVSTVDGLGCGVGAICGPGLVVAGNRNWFPTGLKLNGPGFCATSAVVRGAAMSAYRRQMTACAVPQIGLRPITRCTPRHVAEHGRHEPELISMLFEKFIIFLLTVVPALNCIKDLLSAEQVSALMCSASEQLRRVNATLTAYPLSRALTDEAARLDATLRQLEALV